MVTSKILLAPHNDDEALFAAFTCLREKPLVIIVTDSWKQFNRGDGITAVERRAESVAAMKVLGCEVCFMGIPDTELTRDILKMGLRQLKFNPEVVYAPAIQGGNKHHDLIGSVALGYFPKVVQYTTYSMNNLYTVGKIEIKPTNEERKLKQKALACYVTQINHPWTSPHFGAVENKSEWLNPPQLLCGLRHLWYHLKK